MLFFCCVVCSAVKWRRVQHVDRHPAAPGHRRVRAGRGADPLPALPQRRRRRRPRGAARLERCSGPCDGFLINEWTTRF